MKPESTADLIAALNNSAKAHDYGQKDDTKQTPPPDSIPCTLAGELDTDDEQTAGEASEEPADNMPEQESEENQKDSDEPSKPEAEKEQEKKEQKAKDAARWHDYARAALAHTTPTDAAADADAMLAAFKTRFPNA